MGIKKNKTIKICLSSSTSLILALATLVTVRTTKFNNLDYVPPLSHLEELQLEETLKVNYPERYELVHKLPYGTNLPAINTYAKSVILIDNATGDILYEKNADTIIPPASMTKLFAMYVVDQEVSGGKFTYDQIIPIPEAAYACNMPPHSSLMFLGEGQVVTLEELLLGLSICSGNDAAYAIAFAISGSMEAFISRMNQVAKDLGLTHTHFVEASGYSELNTTTPREMAAFCRVYIKEHPESLKRFHSVPEFTYPKPENLAPGDVPHYQNFSKGVPKRITMSITQKNTNPLLGKLQGCDGLKTGYIDESGYNLALTAKRDKTRFLSITMLGPGENAEEGQMIRVSDGLTLMNFAFTNFADYTDTSLIKPYSIRCYGTKEMCFNAVPAFDVEAICVPFVRGESVKEDVQNVRISVNMEDQVYGPVERGQVVGEIRITLGEFLLDTIPLVADRTTNPVNPIFRLADKLSSML